MSSSIKILIVDDEEVGRTLLEAILTPYNYELVFAKNGVEALEAMKQHKPDMVLCDVMMPLLDGFGVVQEVRKNTDTAHIPFLLITALDDRESLIRGIESGADDYITKPFNRIEIIAKVKNHISLLQYRLGNLAGETSQGPRRHKYDEAITSLFDSSFSTPHAKCGAELLRLGKHSQGIIAKITCGENNFFTHISPLTENSNFVQLSILISKRIDNEVNSGAVSPGKILSTVFEYLEEVSLQFEIPESEKDNFSIAIIRVNEVKGIVEAAGSKQKLITNAKNAGGKNIPSGQLQIIDLHDEKDARLTNGEFVSVISGRAYTFMHPGDILNRVNKNYAGNGEQSIESVFSNIFDQTQELLILKLSI